MSEFTPGPWLPTYAELHQLIRGGGEARHNRLLMAAAPDLLKACQEMLYHASLGPDEVGRQQWEEDSSRMEAAIKKATE